MSFGCVVRPRADRDIDDIADYLAEESGLDIALQFLAEVHEAFALLDTQRNMGWPCKVRHPQFVTARTFRVSARFEKFLIFYQPVEGRIEILRVLHGSKDLEALFSQEPEA